MKADIAAAEIVQLDGAAESGDARVMRLDAEARARAPPKAAAGEQARHHRIAPVRRNDESSAEHHVSGMAPLAARHSIHAAAGDDRTPDLEPLDDVGARAPRLLDQGCVHLPAGDAEGE